jgi:hypothetical protein
MNGRFGGLALGVSALAWLGCGRDASSTSAPPSLDASPAADLGAPAEHARSARDVAARAARHFSRAAAAIGGPSIAHHGGLRVIAPARAPDAARCTLDGGGDFEVRADDLADLGGEAVDEAWVAREARPGVDVVRTTTGGSFEELRVYAHPAAVETARWSVARNAVVVAGRARGGRVELLDGAGRVRVRTDVVVAIDEAGHRRAADLEVRTEAARIVIVATLRTDGLVAPVVLDPAWSSAGTTLQQGVWGSTTLLTSGKVLVAGGRLPAPTAAVELYDPATGAWTAAASMVAPRYGHTATLLPDGRVFVVGGTQAAMTSSLAEIYDPVANTWTTRASSPVAFTQHQAWLLAGPKVLVAGVAATQLYDVATNAWSSAGPLSSVRYGAVSAKLPSGKPIIVGGSDLLNVTLSTAEVWDAATSKWTVLSAAMSTPRDGAFGAMLGGKLVVVGGRSSLNTFTPLSTAESYDEATNTWTPRAQAGLAFSSPSGAVLSDGRALVVGFNQAFDSAAQIFDPAKNAWFRTSRSIGDVMFDAAPTVTLKDGRVLVAGGSRTDAAELFTVQPNGAACGDHGDCASESCVDGVCCASACASACSACDVAGSLGTCTAVTGSPHGTRTCGSGGTYACAAGACNTSCSKNADCAPTAYCAAGACVPQKAQGAACAAAAECASGSCADGVCCNATCAGQCEVCNEVGAVGTCIVIDGDPRGARTPCSGGSGPCASWCDGSDRSACHPRTTTTPCSADGCVAGLETHASFCDGKGSCSDVTKGCGAFACGPTTCKATCTSAADCATGYACNAGTCAPIAGLGDACVDRSTCSSSAFCTDGVCCASVACDAGSSCATSGHKGFCTKLLGTSCAADGECASGHCVDKVCCDSTCGGECQACDAVGSVGTCVPVTGAPHGTRAPCDTGGGDVCKARKCDGSKDPTACVGWVAGAAQTCATAACAGTSFTPAAHCDGAGSCGGAATIDCAPYRCDASGCLTRCTADADCAASFACKAGACVAKSQATCADDGVTAVQPDGTRVPCGAYRCKADGSCGTDCATSSECAPGGTCDTATRICVTDAASAPSQGGCSASPSGGGELVGLAAIATCFASLAVRRRRRDRVRAR